MLYKSYTCDYVNGGVVLGGGVTIIFIWQRPRAAWDKLKSMGQAEGADPIRFRRVK